MTLRARSSVASLTATSSDLLLWSDTAVVALDGALEIRSTRPDQSVRILQGRRDGDDRRVIR